MKKFRMATISDSKVQLCKITKNSKIRRPQHLCGSGWENAGEAGSRSSRVSSICPFSMTNVTAAAPQNTRNRSVVQEPFLVLVRSQISANPKHSIERNKEHQKTTATMCFLYVDLVVASNTSYHIYVRMLHHKHDKPIIHTSYIVAHVEISIE